MRTDILREDKQGDGTYQCRPIDALAEAAVDQCIEERLFGRRTERSVARSTRKSGIAIRAKPDEDGDLRECSEEEDTAYAEEKET